MAIAETPSSSMADFGDFVSNEKEEMELEEAAEPWYKYTTEETADVFYPIYVGEVLNGRYLIEHKLGAGGFSTVWMAYDILDKRNIALKVMSSGQHGEHEVQMQDIIHQDVQDVSHLVLYKKTFLLAGDKHSHHRVLVFPLMGPCLEHRSLKNLSMTRRMSAARQLLEALANIHNAGIVHRGMVSLDNFDRGAKYKAFGRPLKQVMPELWKQGELVRPVEIPKNFSTEQFYLGDFGLAMKMGDPTPQRGYPPMVFCSPDRLHGETPSFACDMWSYMVIFAKLYLGFSPFHSFYQGGLLTSVVECLGPLPEHWKGRFIYSNGLNSWYNQDEASDPDRDLMSKIARSHPNSDLTERNHVHSIMSRVFTYYPNRRPTAMQLLQDPSFQAIMHKYSC